MTEKRKEQKRKHDELQSIRLRMASGEKTSFSERQKVYIADRAKKRASVKSTKLEMRLEKRVGQKTTIIYIRKKSNSQKTTK